MAAPSWFENALRDLQLACAAACFCITLMATLAFQALFHRRSWRLPPGPKGLPILGSWFLFPGGAITPTSLLQVSQKYGDLCLVKLGRCNLVIVSSPDIAQDVLQTHGRQFGSRSRSFVVELTSAQGQDMVFSDYGAHWQKVRRITMAPFFSSEAFRRSVAMWEDEIDAAIADIGAAAAAAIKKGEARDPAAASAPAPPVSFGEGEDVAASNANTLKLRDSSGSEASPASSSKPLLHAARAQSNAAVDIVRRRLTLAVYNMLYRMAFNRRFESMDDAVYKELDRHNMRNALLLQSFRYNVADFFPPVRMFFRSFLRQVRDANLARLQMFKDVFIKEHLEMPQEKKGRSGIDFLLDAESSGEITMKSVLLLLQNINVAALGPMTTLTKWGIIELINHPEVQKQLYKELTSTLGKGGCLKHKDIGHLPFLQAVVKEVLRMHMTVPLLIPHLNKHPETLGGYDIPANSRILVNAWGIANDKRFWDKPEDFCPERFMNEKVDVYGNDYKFLPFGSGRRSCPGARMAFTVLALTFGKLVQAFELLPPPGVEKVIAVEIGGQLASLIINHLRVILKPHDTTSV